MVSNADGRDEAFTSYKTRDYRLHLYETLTGYKFVLLSDPGADSLRFVLRQLHTGPFVEYVVRNPLVDIDSRERGIDNDQVSRRLAHHGGRNGTSVESLLTSVPSSGGQTHPRSVHLPMRQDMSMHIIAPWIH